MFFVVCLMLCKCQSNSQDGRITAKGIYEYKDVRVVVKDQSYNVRYLMLSSTGDTLINNGNFSSLHRWALLLDKDRTLWVFSSDIGHSFWKLDTKSGKYIEHPLVAPIHTDSLSAEVYSTLKLFHPYNN